MGITIAVFLRARGGARAHERSNPFASGSLLAIVVEVGFAEKDFGAGSDTDVGRGTELAAAAAVGSSCSSSSRTAAAAGIQT